MKRREEGSLDDIEVVTDILSAHDPRLAFGVDDQLFLGALVDDVSESVRGLEEWHPHERIAGLVHIGDKLELQDAPNWDPCRVYSLASRSLDPAMQLELGCLFASRAGVVEEPMCEHMYLDGAYVYWKPEVVLHEGASGLPARDRVTMLRLALQAYGNAWGFYRNAYHYYVWIAAGVTAIKVGDFEGDPEKVGDFELVLEQVEPEIYHPRMARAAARTLFALDGIRVCLLSLNDDSRAWQLLSCASGWRGEDERLSCEADDLSNIVADFRERFARSKGQLQPRMEGRQALRGRLVTEFDWLDLLPPSSQNYFLDGEYMRLNLKDPTYNPKGIVAIYCMAVEDLLQRRLGDPIDLHLHTAPLEEASAFRGRYLQDRRGATITKEWRCGDLAIHQFEKYLRQPDFKAVLSKIGADTAFYFRELPNSLRKILQFRHPASHASKTLFKDADVNTVRESVILLLSKLSRRRVVISAL